MQLKKIQMTILSASLTALMCSSVTQASDLQIYAMPTAGQKTIVMMVDVSGSMDWGMSGQNSTVTSLNPKRIEALKDGLRAVLNSNDPKLENVVIGLGKYPGDGNSYSTDAEYMRGKILVEAKKLGPSTKTKGVFDSQQRRDMLAAVNAISVVGGTPTAHGYTEAASYLMGTRTDNYNIEKDIVVYNQNLIRTGSNDFNRKYYNCTAYSTNLSIISGYNYYSCDSWREITKLAFDNISYDLQTDESNPRYYFVRKGTIKQTVSTNSSSYSGMVNSVGKITTDGVQHYNSPLPAIDKRVTCDGQGVYLLSGSLPLVT